MICIFVIFLIRYALVRAQHLNNACLTIEAYFKNISTNPDCWYDPEVTGTAKERAKYNGFLLEEHSLRTEDGYILTTYRLKSLAGLYGKEVIFLQHGISTDASSFMVNKENSIPYFLARQGFDVWLGNFRSSDVCKHERLSASDPKYWDFSFDELALYDLPANFKYIRRKTKRKIFYIGHSLGSTAMGIYASVRSDDARRYIEHAILIAPAFYMRHTKGVGSLESVNSFRQIIPLLPMINYNVIVGVGSFEHQALQRLCFQSMENANMCLELLEVFSGGSQYPIEVGKLPLGVTAVKNLCFKVLLHYTQEIRSGSFRMFDYGPEENMIRYNRGSPPDYNLTDVTIPMSLVYGRTDYLATKEDAIYAFETYGKPNWSIYEIPHNHADFLILTVAKRTLLPLLLKIININIKCY